VAVAGARVAEATTAVAVLVDVATGVAVLVAVRVAVDAVTVDVVGAAVDVRTGLAVAAGGGVNVEPRHDSVMFFLSIRFDDRLVPLQATLTESPGFTLYVLCPAAAMPTPTIDSARTAISIPIFKLNLLARGRAQHHAMTVAGIAGVW